MHEFHFIARESESQSGHHSGNKLISFWSGFVISVVIAYSVRGKENESHLQMLILSILMQKKMLLWERDGWVFKQQKLYAPVFFLRDRKSLLAACHMMMK